MSSKSRETGSPATEDKLLHPEYYEPSEDEDNSPGVAFLEPPQPTPETVAQEKPENVLDVESQTKKPKARRSPKLLVWIIVNILATIGIVFVNKAIFDDPSFRNAQLSFASFHFFVTFGTLHAVSLPRFGFFERRRARFIDILPLAGAMCFNVILPNLSLAYSSVTFYQTVRVLLTPIVAALNYFLYEMTIPRQAAYTLIPVCLGVALVTYYDVQPGATEKPTSFLGVFFAMTGVLASSVYTVWIAYFHKKLEITSVQLLHNQSLVGAVMLLYAIPLIDTLPVFSEVALNKWIMIFMSGIFACIINLSQFIIITGAGPVASTVVGHSKTILIVSLGWIASRRSVSDKSVLGVIVAVGGIVLYSYVMKLYKDRATTG